LNFAWSFMPCDELAGDFLGLFQLDENHIGFYVVDVSGHGVAASLMAVSISRALAPNSSLSSSLLLQADGSFEDQVRSPADVAKELNVRFPIEECGGKFFTMVYGVLNIITHEVRYVSAGHPSMIQSSGWQPPEMLAAAGFMVGVVDGIDFEERRVQLKSGDRLYLYSDGLVEQFNAEGTQFGNDRLCASIARSQSIPLAESVDALQHAVVQWNAGGQLHDDLSILAVEVQ
jgi:sigma-B regulation protein RsbU (phosphoserine phosphatase)